jgi:gas vesicle protein
MKKYKNEKGIIHMKKSLVGFVVGSAIGTTASLLFTTKKGKEIRNEAKNKTTEAVSQVKKEVQQKVDSIKNSQKGDVNVEVVSDKKKTEATDEKKETVSE